MIFIYLFFFFQPLKNGSTSHIPHIWLKDQLVCPELEILRRGNDEHQGLYAQGTTRGRLPRHGNRYIRGKYKNIIEQGTKVQ